MTQSQSNQNVMDSTSPKKGDKFRCEKCGMELQITTDCKCHGNHVHFECCGQQMTKA